MKKITLACIFLCMLVVFTASAQTSNNYITHTLKTGETLSALAKQFNTTVGDIMRLNGMHADSKLVLGSSIKIPASPEIPAEQTKPVPEKSTEITPDSDGNSKTHIVQKGETAFGISKQYNISIDQLKQWNNLPDNNLEIGQALKIVNTKNSFAVDEKVFAGGNKVITEEAKPSPEKSSIIPSNAAFKPQTHIVQKSETVFGISQQYNISIDQLKQWNNLPDNKLEIGQVLNVTGTGNSSIVNQRADGTLNQPAVNTDLKPDDKNAASPENNPSKKQRVTKKEKKAIVPVAENTDKSAEEIAAVSGNEGYFAGLFGKDIRRNKIQTVNGQAMSFKAATGWNDFKYYVLMNDVVIGTIVKLTAATGKTIYAKVLWNLGDMKENEGLACRISNAAVAALGININLFNVEISYY